MNKMMKFLKPMSMIVLAATIFAGNLSFGINNMPKKAEAINILPFGERHYNDIEKSLPSYIKGLNSKGEAPKGKHLTFDFEGFEKALLGGQKIDDFEWRYTYMEGFNVKRKSVSDNSSDNLGFDVPTDVKPGSAISVWVLTNDGYFRTYFSPSIYFEGVSLNMGSTVFNLSSGSMTVSAYDLYKGFDKFYGVLTPVVTTLDGSGALTVAGLDIYADLDNDGHDDVVVEGLKDILDKTNILYEIGLSSTKPEKKPMVKPDFPEGATEEEVEDIMMRAMLGEYAVTLTVLPTTNLNGSYTASLPSTFVNFLERNNVPYYSSVTYMVPTKVNSEADDVDASMKVPGIKKVTKNAKSITVELKALKKKQLKKVTGYEIQYSTKSDFSDAKTVKVNKAKTTKKTIKKLKKGTTYFVRVRYFKKGAAKPYSNWSKIKKVKTKK